MRLLLLLGMLLPQWLQAAGSWVGEAGPVRAVMAERGADSTLIRPPANVTTGVIDEVRWRYRLPAGQEVIAWLCHPGGCDRLGAQSGTSQALKGLPAATPLHFRFSLAPGQRSAVQVGGLQVIVNYR